MVTKNYRNKNPINNKCLRRIANPAQRVNNGTYTFNKQTDSIDIVAHSMGYAYSVGMIDKFIQEGFKLGRLYIIAPENPGGGSSDWTKFTEVYQYGSNLGEPNQDLMYLQDGVAPQSKVKDIEGNYPNTKTARVFIPASITTKGFAGSHSILNYGWIFTNITTVTDKGYVKPR